MFDLLEKSPGKKIIIKKKNKKKLVKLILS